MSEATQFAKSVPTRTESDSMGKIEVPMDRYYGAQTARSLIHFAIGKDTMPPELIRAFGMVKELAAREGVLGGSSAGANAYAAVEIAKRLGAGKQVVTLIPDSAERYLSKKIFEGGI